MSITAGAPEEVTSRQVLRDPVGLVAKKGSPPGARRPVAQGQEGRRAARHRRRQISPASSGRRRASTSCATRSRTKPTLDLTAGRLDAALADALEADGGFLAKPRVPPTPFIGGRMFGANAEEKAFIGEGVGVAVRKRMPTSSQFTRRLPRSWQRHLRHAAQEVLRLRHLRAVGSRQAGGKPTPRGRLMFQGYFLTISAGGPDLELALLSLLFALVAGLQGPRPSSRDPHRCAGWPRPTRPSCAACPTW